MKLPAHITISDSQFDRIRDALQRRTGLAVPSSRKRELQKRITPFVRKEHSVDAFIQKLDSAMNIDQALVNELTIGESYFFRNHPHFAALQNEVFPHLLERKKDRKRLKIWSAGCSTGEEPYSLAIMIERDFPVLRDWDITILATDINTRFLEKAASGRYTSWSFRGVDNDTINRYFEQTESNEYTLDARIRNKVTFHRLNLSQLPERIEPMFQSCDLILCRNVLIYFQTQLATRICEVFSDCLEEEGYLLLGHSEAFPSLKNLNTVYSHATYYYRKQSESSLVPAHSRISLLPGLGPCDPEKMISTHRENFSEFAGGSPRTSIGVGAFASMFKGISDPLEEDLKRVRDLSMDGELQQASELLGILEQGDGKVDFRVYFLKALVADQANEPEEALVHLKQAIFINREFVIGHYYQGVIAERSGNAAVAKRGYRNTCQLAEQMRPDIEVREGGGIRAGRLLEIATERLKELELQHG